MAPDLEALIEDHKARICDLQRGIRRSESVRDGQAPKRRDRDGVRAGNGATIAAEERVGGRRKHQQEVGRGAPPLPTPR